MIKKLFPGRSSKGISSQATAALPARPGFDEQGVVFLLKSEGQPPLTWAQDAYLEQLEEEDLATRLTDRWLIPYDALYGILESEEHASSLPLLCLRPVTALRPQLQSEGGTSDSGFKVFIAGWVDPSSGRNVQPRRTGALLSYDGREELLTRASWALLQAVRQFHAAQQEASGETTNQVGWARIRKLAEKAGAGMDGFLRKTIILRPETLRLNLRKAGLESSPVIEIEPVFEGQPASWLQSFDALQQVQDRYHIVGPDGAITHILISPEVRSVLEVVRGLSGRRVVGDAALSFIRNPYAFLGDDAVKVISPEEHEAGLEQAGIHFHRFSLEPYLDGEGKRITSIELRMAPLSPGPLPGITQIFKEAHEFVPFVHELRLKKAAELPAGFWNGYELELGDFTIAQLQGIEALLERWQQEAVGREFEDVLDLSQYGDRVIGIGEAEKPSSPFLLKEGSQQWLPPDLLNVLGLDGELLVRWDKSSQDDYEEFKHRIAEAKEEGAATVRLPVLEIPLELPIAERLCEVWGERFKGEEGKGEGKEQVPRAVLLIEHNVEESGYNLRREAVAAATAASVEMPLLLRAEVELRDHQMKGVAWLQQLFAISPGHVSGCLLADDMGLGKTLQLLTFITWYLERNPEGGPVLIIAPVSLLDNWERELERFFHTHTLSVLKLYGDALKQAKFKSTEIPESLRRLGIKNLLKPGWTGESKIILTTYETLRDQEFSLARQPWAIVVCDEAQKIKNPTALVTQAAKAMSARFRVACTGTPVENSLTDLWCLFDFIQPGLLGALNEFGAYYRRPIESDDKRDLARLDQLRELIEPQILRRTKADVAKDLPAKIEDTDCRALAMGLRQCDLYKSELSAYAKRVQMMEQLDERRGGILGLLHTLKLVCAHPYSVRPDPALKEESPKMRWLLETLRRTERQGDKVIIFTELRDIQRELQLFIFEEFGQRVTIINGDTSTTSKSGQGRQALIDAFQERPGFGVIILSTVAVGFGVNVQAANHVIHYTRSWNPAKEDQATDRAYRIGQTKDVTVYYPTVRAAEFRTFEETLDELLSRKRGLAGDMLNGCADISAGEFAVGMNIGA